MKVTKAQQNDSKLQINNTYNVTETEFNRQKVHVIE